MFSNKIKVENFDVGYAYGQANRQFKFEKKKMKKNKA